MLLVFGLYPIIHPKRQIFIKDLSKKVEKWKPVKSFILGSVIENTEIIILLFCLPFKFTHAKKLLKTIIKAENYDTHKWN